MASRQTLGSVTLRAVAPSDVPAIAAIEARAFSDPWPASAFLELLQRPHARLMGAFDASGTLCGYCVLLHVMDEGEIANIAVAPATRRGIAARLLDDALEAARAMELAALFLEVRMSNDAARNLYDSRGFEPVGCRRAYYREPLEDALVLGTPGGGVIRPVGEGVAMKLPVARCEGYVLMANFLAFAATPARTRRVRIISV